MVVLAACVLARGIARYRELGSICAFIPRFEESACHQASTVHEKTADFRPIDENG